MSNDKTLSPIDAKSNHSVCKLNRDNISTPDYWIITDGYDVTLAEQKDGESATNKITISKKHFDKLIRWYIRPQKLK